MEYRELIRDRFSCRSYQDRPVEKEIVDRIIEDGLAAPTGMNYQPFRVWVMASKEAVAAVNGVTTCGYGAPLFLAVGADRSKAWVREFDGANFADVDASIAVTHMMLSAHDQGLGSVWVTWFDAPKLQTLYPEMAGYDMIALLALGYPAEDAAPSENHFRSATAEEIASYL